MRYTFTSGGQQDVLAPDAEKAEEMIRRGADLGLLPEDHNFDDFDMDAPDEVETDYDIEWEPPA